MEAFVGICSSSPSSPGPLTCERKHRVFRYPIFDRLTGITEAATE